MELKVISSASGSHWYIVNELGVVLEGAPKRGHGRATRAQMEDWAQQLMQSLEV